MSRKKFIFIVWVVFFTLLIGVGKVSSVEGKNKVIISQESIKKAADREAFRLGYKIDEMNAQWDENNSQWNTYLKTQPLPDFEAKLKGKAFAAVYYSSKSQELGGDLWVFVDKKTAKIIAVLRGR